MKNSKNKVRFSLGISAFAMAMVSLSSIMIVAFYYFEDTSQARDRTVRNVSIIVRQIDEQTRILAQAVLLTLDNIVAISGLAESRDEADESLRVILTPMFTQNPSITAAYIGYGDGEFRQIVSLIGRDYETRIPYKASADASFAVVHIGENLDGTRMRSVQTFSSGGTRIGKEWSEETEFDPRVRPWYRVDKQKTPGLYQRTNPYVFSKTRQPGITISRNLSGSDLGTVGVDLDLRSLNNFLTNQMLTADTRLAIVSKSGTILSHTKIDPVAVSPQANGDMKLSLNSLTTENDPVLSALNELPDTDGLQEFAVDGATYLGRALGVDLGGSEKDRLLIAVPWEEITAPLSRSRNQALGVTAGFAMLVMLMSILIGRRLARPIERLTSEAEAIGNLELSSAIDEVNSPFSEVQKLGEAMATMKSTISVLALYVPRSLVAQLVESGSGGQLGGTRRDLAFLFTDIEGFTTISEKADSATMMRQLSDYFETLSNSILHHNGTIDKYIGDAVMAFWNAPRDDLEMASNACKAALHANNGLTTLNIQWDIDGRMALMTRFGLHMGNAMVGNVGCSDRINYTAMGSSVNAAARLEGLNKFFGTTILASDAIRRRTGQSFIWRRIGMVSPKGVLTPMTVFELIGLDRTLADMPGIPAVKDEVRASVDEWNEIFETYLGRDWQESSDRMTEFLKRHPGDKVAEFYLDRAEQYGENPPEPDWNGAEEFSSK